MGYIDCLLTQIVFYFLCPSVFQLFSKLIVTDGTWQSGRNPYIVHDDTKKLTKTSVEIYTVDYTATGD